MGQIQKCRENPGQGLFFEQVLTEYLKDIASKRQLLAKISRNILNTKIEEKAVEIEVEPEESESMGFSYDDEEFEGIESTDRKMIGDINYSNPMLDSNLTRVDMKQRNSSDGKKLQTQSSISASVIKLKLKEEITGMYQ